MGVVALVAWLATAGGGLFLLAIWLIEYDRGYQTAAATRLPVPVISAHALLAVAGLVVWGAYILLDDDGLAWISLAILAVVATLGLVMATRWQHVYRTSAQPDRQVARARAGVTASGPQHRPAAPGDGLTAAGRPSGDLMAGAHQLVPPERHFPVAVVILHGVCAAVTIVLVVLTALEVGGS
ncbi:MAG TPA: hypothetical protein VGG35_22290 [Streptosporangiaceae bacterium]|jgi:hypothetical protein